MKQQALCAAFCDQLEVRKVPVGFAVRTGFSFASGDTIGFYIVRHPSKPDVWRLEDSGMLVPTIEANGVSLDSGPRREAFQRLLAEYRASYDEESRELHTDYAEESEIPKAAAQFVALLLRMQDFELMHSDVVANTFRHDVEQAIAQRFTNVAQVELRAKLLDGWNNYIADAVIRPQTGLPMAVYFATTEARVDEAVLFHWELRAKGQRNPVALVLETAKPANVSNRALQRAHNRLEAIPVFRGDEESAMEKLALQIGIEPNLDNALREHIHQLS